MLQWGHGDGAVEEEVESLRPATAKIASMGPRRWSRGREARSGKTWHVDSASMGPRRWSRGREPEIPAELVRAPCFNGATAMEPWKSRYVSQPLALA